ncbi:MAG: Na/Pi symporter [Clostridia bacterium]|nr:Na/Pi symporter [Clostridia bacterium]
MNIVASVFTFLAGLGVFLLGMKLISVHMQGLAADNIKHMLSKTSNNKLASVGLGVGASFLLQSSTATTVILLGLVNAGLVNLFQSALIIMGANIGTTFTVLFFSFSYLPISEILSSCALIGVFMVLAAKNPKIALAGWVVSGFGLIFIGLNMMSNGVDFLKTSEVFSKLLLSLDNMVLLVIVGLLFSAITQSSNATTGVVITLAEAGLMPVTAAFAIIMGSNVGTCVTAMLASVGTSLNARRAAVIHLMYNAAGVMLFLPFVMVGRASIDRALSSTFTPSLSVAYFHILFNMVTTILLLPFAKNLTELAIKCVPEKNSSRSKIMTKTG